MRTDRQKDRHKEANSRFFPILLMHAKGLTKRHSTACAHSHVELGCIEVTVPSLRPVRRTTLLFLSISIKLPEY